MPSSKRSHSQSDHRRILAWRKRFDATKREAVAGELIGDDLRQRTDELEQERDALLASIGKPTREQMRLLEVAPPPDPARRELLKLQYEIEEDLAAGRLTQDEYDDCKRRIQYSLDDLDAPLPPGETIRVIGIPRKKIDIDLLAQAYWLAGLRQARERRGKPPLTPEEEQMEQVMWMQARAQTRERERQQAADAHATVDRKQEAARRRFARNKPKQVRQATWDWLLDQGLSELPAGGLLGSVAHAYGILGQPELLRMTIIQLPDNLEYVIDQQAAYELGDSADPVSLVRLHDRERITASYASVEQAIAAGPLFDQLDV